MAAESKNDKIRAAQRIRIPVRYVDGHWELGYGGAIKVKNGSIGELTVSREQVDPDLLKTLTAKRWVKILDEGTELRLALTVRTQLAPNLDKAIVPNTRVPLGSAGKLSDETRFVPVWLGPTTKAQAKRKESTGGLWLALEGAEPRALESSAVSLPEALGVDPAISVNHAFTVLSEKFEPWRLSHTGSIYERVFYREPDNFWYPLDDLRTKEMVVAERKIMHALWQEVERLLKEPL